MLVVDASVAVKWFIPEKNADQAEGILLSGRRLLAPELISIEVAAAFTRRLWAGELNTEMINTLLQKWRSYLQHQAVFLERNLKHQYAAEQLSMELSHPLQDCLYLAIANHFKVPLVTADKKFLQKAKPAGYDVIPL